jgi:tRNA 5-methylaminomethyl-2-thiouridine biosynthesis bifunctional protein
MINLPYSQEFDDIYFALEDGLSESRYVFLENNNLPAEWEDNSHFTIGETGFGTGLNFLCTWSEFEKTTKPHQHLTYYSFEKFPLSASDIQKYLAHWSDQFGGRLERLVAQYPLRIGGWHKIELSNQVTLILIFDDVNRAIPELNAIIDCWYLDGHAPAKNPDMWSDVLFQSMRRLSRNGSRFATFTAAGFVRRALTECGFDTQKIKGFGHKRDMTIGVFKPDNPAIHNKSGSSPSQNIAVIGGGLAGTTMANFLVDRGASVTLYEKNSLASGASGNIRGLYNPRFTSERHSEADFFSSAFSLFYRQKKNSKDKAGWMANGCLHLINDSQKEKRFEAFCKNWGWHPDHARLVSAEEATGIAGVPLSHRALYLPDSGMISPYDLCKTLSDLVTYKNEDVTALEQYGTNWQVNRHYFDSVILCGSFDVLNLGLNLNWPLQKIRGQLTHIQVNPDYSALNTNLCYGGYASAPFAGQAVIGSSFQHWLDDTKERFEDNEDNITKLQAVCLSISDNLKVTGSRVGFRCSSKDRIPIIGSIDEFANLYVSTAHGSHGILSSIMAADYISSLIFRQPQILPQSVIDHISPKRFQKKS